MHNRTKGCLLVGIAGTLWGTVVFFVTKLLDAQLPLSTIVFYRMFFAFLSLFFFLLFTDISKLKIDRVLLKYVAAIGLISQAFFNISYFSAIKLTSISTAVTLLYTAPIFIALMAKIFYQETFTKNKLLALLLCVTGCFLTITGGSLQSFQYNLKGVLLGLSAGISFGSLTIISKPIADKYHPYTIVFYSICFGTLFYLPFSQPLLLFQSRVTPLTWLYALSLSIVSTVIALIIYFSGLATGIDASEAGIISTVEVIISVMVSFLFFQEQIVGWKLIGILMVIGSVIVVQLDSSIGMNAKASTESGFSEQKDIK